MNQRTYNQYCPIAHGLDLIGDRWTLLIIRDLLPGPKRFSDLFAGLPGIGTNLLAERLKALDQAGIVQRRTLPPPAPAQLYELTDYGRGLEEMLTALAQWGAQTLGEFQAGQVLSRNTLLLTARALVRAWPTEEAATTYRITLTDEQAPEPMLFHGAGPTAALGPGQPGDAWVEMVLDIATLYALAGGAISFQMALDQGRLRVSTVQRGPAHTLPGQPDRHDAG